MYTYIQMKARYAKSCMDAWFERVFKEQAGGAELIATIVIVAVVLVLALVFRDKLTALVGNLWNTLVKGKSNSDYTPTVEW